MSQPSDVTSMAVFCDFENVALGVEDARYEKFDIKKVLERLLLKGSIVVKKAYCDWDRYKAFKKAMHEASFELIEIPHVRQAGKNSADIRLVVDALDLCYTKSHVDTFVIVSGDSDFSPLVSKLRENDKTVIGVGVKDSTSDLLISNCDEFIFYDDLVRERAMKRASSARRGARASGEAPAGEAGKAAAAPRSRASPRAGRGAKQAAAEAQSPTAELQPATAETPARDEASAAVVEAAGAGAASEKGTGSRNGEHAAIEAGKRPRRRSRSAQPGGRERQPQANGAPSAGVVETSGNDDWVADWPGPETPSADVAAEAPAPAEEDRAGKAIDLVVETVEALAAERGGAEAIWGSLVKQTLKRRKPGFNEAYYGFRSFNALLEAAQARGLLALTRDEKSGGYTVRAAAA